MRTLSCEEQERYSRHILLPEVGVQGQERLKRARVLIIGAGGLGSSAALYLAAAGVGTLGIADGDVVECSNLQRQILHSTETLGISKVESARLRLRALNPHVHIETHPTYLSPANVCDILATYDVVIDGTDNFATRYLINDAAGILHKPLVHGSVSRYTGYVSIFDVGRQQGCYRCLYPAPPPLHLVPNCADSGVLGVLPGLVGTLQAAETLKLLLHLGTPLYRRLLVIDALTMQCSTLTLPLPNPACVLCGTHPSLLSLQEDHGSMCSRMLHNSGYSDAEISVAELYTTIRTVTLIDVREAHERERFFIEGSIHIPLGEFSARIAEIRTLSPPLVLYCQSGERSSIALSLMHDANIPAKHLRGGLTAWQEYLRRGVSVSSSQQFSQQ
ncbi:MAG: molybdopterin-synthase adenylyltransferase MoeB [Bacteroidota bacterium]|nr:molybdopterin-synthase adenylyltransferase MoeB [Candidatus Kapabacteria bacterium]MDW8219319.1 molybdopterin-synthase adenylyltransferase MoeB [Bacteroidota bacterium]